VVASTGRIAGCRAAVWGFLGTFAPALVDLSTSNWFGAGDLQGLLFFTLPLLLVLVVSGIYLARKLAPYPMWLGLVIGGTAGVSVGFLWTLANALLLGPWFGAWSFPVLLCWTTGGALSLAAAATSASASGWRRLAFESVIYSFVALAALYVYRPAVIHLRHDQHLTLVFGRIRPTNTGPAADDSRELLISGEKELLALAGIGDSVEVLGGHAANTANILGRGFSSCSADPSIASTDCYNRMRQQSFTYRRTVASVASQRRRRSCRIARLNSILPATRRDIGLITRVVVAVVAAA